MKVIDRTKIYKSYPGNWVAVAQDQETVISVHKTLKEVLAEAKALGVSPIVMYVPKGPMMDYIGIHEFSLQTL